MEGIIKELGIPENNITKTETSDNFSIVVHSKWLKSLIKYKKVDLSPHIPLNKSVKLTNDIPYTWVKVFIKVLPKINKKVLPLPRSKLLNGRTGSNQFTYSQLIQYVTQTNHRNLWRKTHKKYCQPDENIETSIISLSDYDALLSELIIRYYGCDIIKRNPEVDDNKKYQFTLYESHANLFSAICAIETENYFFIIFNNHMEYTLQDCLTFSPALLDNSYSKSLFIIYQLLHLIKSLHNRGLCLGNLSLNEIYMKEDLWLQIIPEITNNLSIVDGTSLSEQKVVSRKSFNVKDEPLWRESLMKLECVCNLWTRGRISNLDYLIHLNELAGRRMDNVRAHVVVPWVTDFTSRCGKNWRDLTKSKYRLTKGDRQLDLTYEIFSKEFVGQQTSGQAQVPHHVSDVLSDITYYVYMARRTPKEVLCKYVRNNWVPAEYPVSIQRMQEWTPDECIPQFYTDPTVFKTIHEDLADLEVPSWATSPEDFIMKHREALESTFVSENLHHWIDLTFGYKLSGSASVRAKNVCLSLVDGHTSPHRGGAVQLLTAPHPQRSSIFQPPSTPPRIHWCRDKRKSRDNESPLFSDEDEEEPSQQTKPTPTTITHRSRSRSNSNRNRSQSRHDLEKSPSDSKHYRVQKPDINDGTIYLPKDYNPVKLLTALENFDNFNTKCFMKSLPIYTREETKVSEHISLYPIQIEERPKKMEDDNSFTNHLFEQSYQKKRLSTRYAVDTKMYKQQIKDNRSRDIMVLGCLIVEMFLHSKIRPLKVLKDNTFQHRFNTCKIVLDNNYNLLPKCVRYITGLLFNKSCSTNASISMDTIDIFKELAVTDKGLPTPTALQMLQPILFGQLIPFPATFSVLYHLIRVLNEYELTQRELNIICMYDCDGLDCKKYQSIDKTKIYFEQRIAEGKVLSCITNLESFINKIPCYSQFEIVDLFLPHYMELLDRRETSILAAWYLFDSVSKTLGPVASRKYLLRRILALYDDEDILEKVDGSKEIFNLACNRRKSVKLYHNIFLLQLIVRFGLQCFLDNFMQHLVEAVGGYKDFNLSEASSPGHYCIKTRKSSICKKLRYSDDVVKSALSAPSDIVSPDTSYGSETIPTPNIERIPLNESEKRLENLVETEVFHFESDGKSISSNERPKSPTSSTDSYTIPCKNDEPLMPLETYFHDSNVEDESQTPEVTLPERSSPVELPQTTNFKSYLNETDSDMRKLNRGFAKSLDLGTTRNELALIEMEIQNDSPIRSCKISEMSYESLIWLSHRLGPVVTCRYVTRNLLKMLTLCYIGKENLQRVDVGCSIDELEGISITSSTLVGDKNAFKVVNCLTNIVALYGEHLILVQYLPHMCDLIASCRKKITGALEGGVIACLHLFKYLVPFMSDIKLMEQLQDVILKNMIHPTVRLISTTRCNYPSGSLAREALARKFLDTLYVLAVRIGAEMTRKYLCVPTLQRFFLAFDKATGNTDSILLNICDTTEAAKEHDSNNEAATPVNNDAELSEYIEICRDGTSTSWSVSKSGVCVNSKRDASQSPPYLYQATIQEELQSVFTAELAHQVYQPFCKLIGQECLDRTLRNLQTIQELCDRYDHDTRCSSSCTIKHSASFDSTNKTSELRPNKSTSKSSEPVKISAESNKEIHSSSSFGSNVALIGNRIEIIDDDVDTTFQKNALDVVSYKMDNELKNHRQLRGDWLMYWEHEIGRSDKDTRFNLKQIKLQTYVGHTQTVKAIYSMDNENSFMSASKDKTVRLWSLRNQGDGSTVTSCNWSYCGHRKSVLSLTFVESIRLAVSTDTTVHIWDPYMESVVSQLESNRPVTIVKSLAAPSRAVLCAADSVVKMIDSRTCSYTHEMKLSLIPNLIIRCMCISPSNKWAVIGLASGTLVLLDLRTGLVLAQWKAHDGDVVQLVTVGENAFVSSSLDQSMMVWSATDGKLKFQLKGCTESVHCMSMYNNELISCTTSNRLGVHTIQQDTMYSSSKLKSETFRGTLTCMSVLPLNRLLLLASDTGNITLLC